MSQRPSNLIDVGRLAGAFGVKGWIKVVSNTDPKDNIVKFSPWWLKTRHGVKVFEVDEYQLSSEGAVVHFKGVDDRDSAALLKGVNVAIDKQQLPPLDGGEYYWHQLIGMRVNALHEGQSIDLGVVAQMLETGANDVMVVAPDERSCDDRERLVPYVESTYVKQVDLENELISVDWDPAF